MNNRYKPNDGLLKEIDDLTNKIFDKYHAAKPGTDLSSLVIDSQEAEDLAIAAHSLVNNRGSEDKCVDALASITFVLTMIYRGEWEEIISKYV